MKLWKTLDSKMAFDHRWFKVRQDTVELPNGKILDDYFVWVKDDVSLVVPITEDGKWILVRQYKHGAGKVVTEFPAGYLNKGELPEVAARRELKEETGYTCDNLIHLTTVTNDATKETGKVYVYLAEGCNKVVEVAFDENEDIETVEVSVKEVLEMVVKGEIWVTVNAFAALLAMQRVGVLEYGGID